MTVSTDPETTNTLFDALGDYAPPALDRDEQLRRESDLLDAKRCDRHYQGMVEAGYALTDHEQAEWAHCRAIVCADIAGEW